jgi:hypothetical protein
MVAGSQEEKCGLKYEIYTFSKKGRAVVDPAVDF